MCADLADGRVEVVSVWMYLVYFEDVQRTPLSVCPPTTRGLGRAIVGHEVRDADCAIGGRCYLGKLRGVVWAPWGGTTVGCR